MASAERPPSPYDALSAALERHGLAARGGFHWRPEEPLPAPGWSDRPATLVMVGMVGGAAWPRFSSLGQGGRDPLDGWTRQVVDPVARSLGAVAIYPNDRPYRPFQQWAKRAEPVFDSPLGLLIHPEYGLWHAYRAAVLVPGAIALPRPAAAVSPCADCASRPCLSACPVGAFTAAGYDVPACLGHLGTPQGARCREGGCRARDACPVGTAHRYDSAQIRFHMAAFRRAVQGEVIADDQ